MKIVTPTTQFVRGNAVAIGSFDGLHLAHRHILGLAKHYAMQHGYGTLAYTFTAPPAAHFSKLEKVLFTPAEKQRAFAALGIDYIAIKDFDNALASQSKEAFADYLIHTLQAKCIIAGFNFRFGKQAAGTVDFLRSYGKQHGVEVIQVPPVYADGKLISSSAIRKSIDSGNLSAATAMLGRAYSVSGQVVYGKQLGRKLGFPTANLVPDVSKLLPPHGVYVSQVCVGADTYFGVTNVGVRPTVDDGEHITVETHVLEQQRDLYGKQITVLFLHQLRREQTFESVAALQQQIEVDSASAQRFITKYASKPAFTRLGEYVRLL